MKHHSEPKPAISAASAHAEPTLHSNSVPGTRAWLEHLGSGARFLLDFSEPHRIWLRQLTYLQRSICWRPFCPPKTMIAWQRDCHSVALYCEALVGQHLAFGPAGAADMLSAFAYWAKSAKLIKHRALCACHLSCCPIAGEAYELVQCALDLKNIKTSF